MSRSVREVSFTTLAAQSVLTLHQPNGVVRVHANNGGYLFSFVRTQDGQVHMFQNGFGTDTLPEVIWKPK